MANSRLDTTRKTKISEIENDGNKNYQWKYRKEKMAKKIIREFPIEAREQYNVI